MRFKPENLPEDYLCFGRCCHVRSGSLFLGLLQMLLQLLMLCWLALVIVHPELDQRLASERLSPERLPIDSELLPPGENLSEPSSSEQAPTANPGGFSFAPLSVHHSVRPEDRCMTFAVSLFSLLVAAMLVYGTVWRRPGYLLPYFVLQVFDFTITCLTLVGYYSYAPDLKASIAEKVQIPALKQQLLALDPPSLALICMAALVALLVLKAYLLGMVWSCYQYLLRVSAPRAASQDPEFVLPASDQQLILPPKYEDIYTNQLPSESCPAARGDLPPQYSPA